MGGGRLSAAHHTFRHRRASLAASCLATRGYHEAAGMLRRPLALLYLEEHEQATLEEVALLVSHLRSLASPKDHSSALAILRKATAA